MSRSEKRYKFCQNNMQVNTFQFTHFDQFHKVCFTSMAIYNFHFEFIFIIPIIRFQVKYTNYARLCVYNISKAFHHFTYRSTNSSSNKIVLYLIMIGFLIANHLRLKSRQLFESQFKCSLNG